MMGTNNNVSNRVALAYLTELRSLEPIEEMSIKFKLLAPQNP